MRLFLALLLVAACVAGAAASSPTCRDMDGNPVDWFFGYKLPSLTHSSDPTAHAGFKFAYKDANTPLSVTDVNLQDKEDALAYTLEPVYANRHTLAVLMYDDQSPDGHKASSSYAHSKGVVAFDRRTGFWLIHSTPRYAPYLADGYEFPENEHEYGQTFLCVNYDADVFESEIAKNFLVNRPNVYDSNLPSSMSGLSALRAVAAGTQHDTPLHTRVAHLTSLGGKQFTVFAKSRQWDNDLYEQLVAPYYGADLYTETWMRPYHASYCKSGGSRYNVQNVAYVSFHGDLEWHYTKDHAKWAMSQNASHALVCVGDINRNLSQRNRGGGTACTVDPDFWDDMYAIVESTDKC